MKHASLRRLSSPAAFRAGDAPVDLHEPGEKEVPQGCRERPGSQCDGSRPCSASQSGASHALRTSSAPRPGLRRGINERCNRSRLCY